MATPLDKGNVEAVAAISEVTPNTSVSHFENSGLGASHVPTVTRLTLVSWGETSLPPLPLVDDAFSVVSRDEIGGEGDNTRFPIVSPRSGTRDFVEENGRTYHSYKDGKYLLPNDLFEQKRLDLQHALFLLTTHGRLYLAPITNNLRNVLDIGTGTGIWAIEFSQVFPESRVLGTDLSAIQLTQHPSNCTFRIHDAEAEWTFSTKFDYIHGRALASCFKDPSYVIRQAFEACAPGGYFELQDAAYPFRFAIEPDSSSAMYRWTQLLCDGAAKAGRPLTNAHNYKRWMIEAGFEDVVEQCFYWPNGPWTKGEYYKSVGLMFRENLLAGLEGMSLRVLGLLGWSTEQRESFLVSVRDELKAVSVYAVLPIVFVYGRKPL